jgi:signal transduction histidine kinase
MIYAAVGLGLLFVAWGVISRKGIDQISDLLLEERLATAQSVAAAFAADLRHIRYDLEEDMEIFGVTASDHEVSRIAEESFNHLRGVDEFALFEVIGLVLTRENGSTVARAPASFTDADVERIAPGDTWPLGPYTPSVSDAGEGAIIVKVPIQNRVDNAPATAYAIVGTLSSPDPLVGFLPMGRQDEVAVDSPSYHLEIIDHNGLSVLGIGPDHYDAVGKITPHWDGVREIVQTGRQEIIRENRHDGVVALAVVPITGSRLYILAMRHDDVAISAPERLQDVFILIGVVGFVGALIVVAISTRRVVRPTSELTAVARRMAMGDLDSPVRVSAQDEIGQLAESIETMRVQLARAREQALRSNQELEQRVAERTEQLRRALGQVISAQEEERKRVARDLHDGLAQEMVILTRRLDSARERLDPDGADQAELKELSDISRASLASIREISRALRPSVLDDLGLIPALSWVASEFKRRSNVEVEQHLPEDSFAVADEPTLILFRAAQEAFANIDRHSGATRASISLTRTNGSIELQICDNGCGFDMASSLQELARRGHLGIIGMLERVELVGGELKIESTRNGTHDQFNTRVTATIPFDPV